MPLEPVSSTTPRPLRATVLHQEWRDVVFLHWRVDPELVRPLLPAGTEPDLLDGATYVGLIGFRMVGLGFFGGPSVPHFGTFGEVNVRLYATDAQGRRSVVFASLDADRLVPVLAARAALALPYMWSAISAERDGDWISYRSQRRWPQRGVTTDFGVRVGDPIAEPTREQAFVTARWGLHTRAFGATRHLSNSHPAWPLHDAELTGLDDGLVAAAGLSVEGPPTSVLYAPSVPVRFGPARS